ncbi:MAG: MFS transporter, partial [Pseudomonadota bacterium]
ALVVLALFTLQPLWQVSLFMFAVGIFGASYGVLMAHARSFFPLHRVGRGVTLMNFFTIGGVGIAQFAMGQVAQSRFDPVQPEQTYSLLFAIYATIVGLTLIVYVFSSDRKPGQSH